MRLVGSIDVSEIGEIFEMKRLGPFIWIWEGDASG